MSMPAVINTTLDTFSLALVLVLIISLKYTAPQKNRLSSFFSAMLYTTLLVLSASIVSWVFSGSKLPAAHLILAAANFLIFFFWYILKIYSSLYLFTYVNLKTTVSNIFLKAFFAVGIISVILLIISQFTGLMFFIDENNYFERGRFFKLAYAGLSILYLLDLTLLFIYINKLSKRDLRILFTFEVLPIIALAFMFIDNTILLINPALSLSLIILYVRIQMMFTSELVALRKRAEEQTLTIMDGIAYANRIQRNLLPPESEMANSFSDHSVIWQPRDVVGGDIYWIKRFEKGTVLSVCDCTGHGTSGALLSMLVISALEAVVWPSNANDPAGAIYRIDERIAKAFSIKKLGRHEPNDFGIRDGCDIAILFIANDGSITISSSHINIFICDGKQVRRIKGRNLFIGESRMQNKDEAKNIFITPNPNNKFYIASDGLFEQPGTRIFDQSSLKKDYMDYSNTLPFGYKTFEKILLENHNEKQSVINDKVWEAFERHRAKESRVDDFELISFTPK